MSNSVPEPRIEVDADLDGYLILTVDDDDASLRLLSRPLEAAGFSVVSASGGLAALELYKRLRPDLVLLDVVMPMIDGNQVCSSIREMDEYVGLPVLMLTWLHDLESVEKAFADGATDFITKPINWALLGQRVRYALRSTRTARESNSSQAALRRTQRLARLGHWSFDHRSGRVHCADEVRSVLDVSSDSTLDLALIKSRLRPDSRGRIQRHFRRVIREGAASDTELRFQMPGGNERVVTLLAEANRGPQGKLNGLFGVVRDVTVQRHARDRLKYLSQHDALTGLPNRTLVEDRLRQAIREVELTLALVGVILVGLGRLGELGATLGQDVRDQFLKASVTRLKSCLRVSDTLSRRRGEEFVVLLPDLSKADDSARVARRILNRFEKPLRASGHERYVEPKISAALPSDALELEITESVLMHNMEQARPVLEDFRSDGIDIAIDDFGTGYSSLAYLCTLPVNRLRIDRSFVLGMTEGQPREHTVVRATVDLGHALGMSVVAEGAEDEGTAQALAALGCDRVQGFHFARPMTVTELADWLANGGRGSGLQQAAQSVLR